MQHAFYSSMIVSKAPQNIKSVEDSSRKNGKDPRRISSIVLVLFRLYSFPLQRTSLHFSELSSAPASHLVLCDSQGMLLSSFSEVQRLVSESPLAWQDGFALKIAVYHEQNCSIASKKSRCWLSSR